MHKIIIFSLFLFLLVPSVGSCADIPGAKDPKGIKRYEGSDIIRYEYLKFDRFQAPLGKMLKFDFGTKQSSFEKDEWVEGEVTRVSYRIPDPVRSSYEVFKNYEDEFLKDGWEIVWKASGKAGYGNSFPHIYESLKDNDQLFTYNDAQGHVLTAKKPSEGLTAILFVTKFEYGLSRGLNVQKGDPIVQLDLISSKKMDDKMVLITASEMQKSIDQKGSVALYGILFDFNQATTKAESIPVISEIAKFLKESETTKVIITGHTDSVGSFEANRELSQKRALSVIDSLANQYGIDRKRLRSFGASSACPVASNDTEDGRSKNRRVEIVKE